jgi:hypothetical protein
MSLLNALYLFIFVFGLSLFALGFWTRSQYKIYRNKPAGVVCNKKEIVAEKYINFIRHSSKCRIDEIPNHYRFFLIVGAVLVIAMGRYFFCFCR